MNTYQRLNAARAAFHSIKLRKTGHNKFAGYDYFELGDFLIPALQCFHDAGLAAVVRFEKELAVMSIIDVEKPEEHEIIITSPMGSAALKGCHEVQNIGAVETYQRRYLWVAALEIVEHDALDASTGKGKPTPIKGTDGAEDSVSEDRRNELDQMALDMIEGWREGHGLAVARDYYALESNDDKVYLWKCFAAESKMRAEIKMNSPNKVAA